ncbi:calcyphosin-2-like [Gigantopelta aegis]|uniref:calcyphosin-2-like n=1 Tax=Gigantopelta aegis TaxID=1735272 RepID=UPI001B88A677|nr:calcyphosin-2-like [Gigantopelta aegis]
MNFGIHGTSSPRVDYRNLPGSARRPGSARSNRNPITGEEIPCPVPHQPTQDTSSSQRPQSRPDSVPSLNLKYLKDEDIFSKPINPYHYSLDTPNTASTVSWGSPQNTSRFEYKSQKASSSVRPNGVPGLSIAAQEPAQRSYRKPLSAKPKQPSAWDKEPVPENVAPPSVHHQQMYKQYQDELKQSYRAHVAQTDIREKDIAEKMEALKKMKTAPPPDLISDINNSAVNDVSDEEDVLQQSWAKQRYSTQQLLRKMDADGLLEYNKKEKLLETVLADQLSRAVISDPEQNQRTSFKAYDHRKGRGSNRFMHESRVSTPSTAEDLMSKRVRFGARIVSRNGHDALRELTGFFFHWDNTLTIYEFRQFGKSAKAMPFIHRGQFVQPKGPKCGNPYTLADICSGSNLYIPTSDQHCLPATMVDKKYAIFRITDVDKEIKAELLLDGVATTERQATFARLHFPSKEEYENQQILHYIQSDVKDRIKKRAIKTVIGLGRYYRKLDDYDTGLLIQNELEAGLGAFHIDVSQQSLDAVWEILDPEGSGSVDYGDYMRAILGEMNEYRKSLIRKAFQKVDTGKKGFITVNEIKKFFSPNYKPSKSSDVDGSALQAFLNAVCVSSKQEEVQYVEFEEYHEGLSIGVATDQDFANILRNTWTI